MAILSPLNKYRYVCSTMIKIIGLRWPLIFRLDINIGLIFYGQVTGKLWILLDPLSRIYYLIDPVLEHS
jgi:hypothetical protein